MKFIRGKTLLNQIAEEVDKSRPILCHSSWNHLLCAMTASVVLSTFTEHSFADEPLGLTYDPAIDVPLTTAAGALVLGLRLGYGSSKSTYAQIPDEPSGIDKWAPEHETKSYDTVSDGFLYSSIAVGLLAPTLAGIGKTGQWWKQGLLFCEAFSISLGVTEVVKFAVRRPRPYTQDQRTGDISDDLSFFSGHAATTATVLFFAARALDLTYRIPLWGRLLLYLGASAITVTVSVLRVAAGKHYPTDVIVGATVGTAIGFLIPQLHRQKHVEVSAAPIAGGGAAIVFSGNF